jgi:hypothetical protein
MERKEIMSTPAVASKDDGITYQYFWLKVCTEAEVEAGRTTFLDNASTRPDGSSRIMRPGIVPKKAIVMNKGLDISVGIFHDPAMVAEKGLLVDAMEFEPHYTKQEVADWIKTDPGKKWKGTCFVVLCSVALRAGASR